MEGSVRLGGASVASVEAQAAPQVPKPETPNHQDDADQQVHDGVVGLRLGDVPRIEGFVDKLKSLQRHIRRETPLGHQQLYSLGVRRG